MNRCSKTFSSSTASSSHSSMKFCREITSQSRWLRAGFSGGRYPSTYGFDGSQRTP